MKEENTPASPDAHDRKDATQEFPTLQPPPPPSTPGAAGPPAWSAQIRQPAEPPGPPAWSAQTPQPAEPQRRRRKLAALGIGLSLSLLLALPATVVTFTPVGEWIGFTSEDSAPAQIAQQDGGAQQAGDGAAVQNAASDNGQPADLRQGAVFLMSNDPIANEIVAFSRNEAGRLREVGRYKTGGTGSGSFEDSAQALVLGSAEGEASPIQNVDKAELLFAVNAGSNSVSVFKVNADKLELVSTTASGGEKPVSLTVNRGLLYVLNSGEFDNRLASSPEDGLENCTTGQLPSVTGFRVTPDGQLTEIQGSTRVLSGHAESGCAQVSFTPDGKTLIVSERIAGRPGPEDPGGTAKGGIQTFPVRSDGTLGSMSTIDPVGNGPFGFTFSKDGKILMTEQNGAFSNIGGGYVASYRPTGPAVSAPDPALNGPVPTYSGIGGPVPSTSTDPCWIVLTDDQRMAFVSSAIGMISTFSVGLDGSMTLLHPAATSPDGLSDAADYLGFGVTDLSLSRDSKYVYVLQSFEGKVMTFLVNPNGLLTFVEQYEVFDLSKYVRNEGPPMGIAVF